MLLITRISILFLFSLLAAASAKSENCLRLAEGKNSKILSRPIPNFQLKWNNEEIVDCSITGKVKLTAREASKGLGYMLGSNKNKLSGYELNCGGKTIGTVLNAACKVAPAAHIQITTRCYGDFYVWPKEYEDYFDDRFVIKVNANNIKTMQKKISCNEDGSKIFVQHKRSIPGSVEGTNNSVIIFTEHFANIQTFDKDNTYEF